MLQKNDPEDSKVKLLVTNVVMSKPERAPAIFRKNDIIDFFTMIFIC